MIELHFVDVLKQLAPENTQLSFQRAVESGGEGLETDVIIRSAELCSFILTLHPFWIDLQHL